jgi:hypothetical protein
MRCTLGLGLNEIAAFGRPAFIPCLSNANATGGIALSCAGSLLAYAANTLRWGCLDGKRAVLVEAAATNLIAAYAAPTDLTGIALRSGSTGTLSVVADIADQAEAGISGMTNGKAYLLDNSTGTTTATMYINGPFATDQDFAASVWLRAGTSGIAPTIRTGYGNYTVHDAPAGTAYSRAYFTKSDLTTGGYASQDLLWVRVPAGGTAYVALPQAEQGAAQPSSYIRTSGVAATRAADLVTAPITADVSGGVRVRGTFRMDAVKGDYDRVFQLDDGTTANAFWLLWLKGSPDRLYWQYKFNGDNIAGGPAGFIALGETFDCDVTATGDGVSGVVNGVQFSKTFSSTPAPVTNARIGGDSIGANIPARLLCSEFIVTGVPA